MELPIAKCPRCFFSCDRKGGLRFCPRCGLAGPRERAADRTPLRITLGQERFEIGERIGIGSISTLYRCRSLTRGTQSPGVIKIARDACTNALVANEAEILRFLQNGNAYTQFRAFLPRLEHSFTVDDPNEAPRQANLLQIHEEIRSSDELYSLAEVRACRPDGLDGRDIAWIWRRLLYVLGYIHSHGLAHGAVLPMHVLIEPREHKLLLIDWCGASRLLDARAPASVLAGGYLDWYRQSGGLRQPVTAALDISLGARCMIELLAGDGGSGEMPPSVDAAIQRHLRRCLS